MGVPDCPRINSGVLASSDPAFWPLWTAPQYGCLVPALPKFYFNQLSLRLVVKANAVRGQVIDGQAGAPFYNVSIGEQPGDWRVEKGAVFKGTERALIFHQAGEEKRGIDAAPDAMRPFLHELVRPKRQVRRLISPPRGRRTERRFPRCRSSSPAGRR